MMAPPIPPDEPQRLAALLDLAVLDTEAEERFDRLTRLAARILEVPIALVSLIDADRQWFKSRVGLDAMETARDISFCGHAVLDDELFVIPDALDDARFQDNPLVVGDPSIRFYAGRPLRASGGERIGTLCVIDRKPRALGPDDRQTLHDLAALVERELQQRTLVEAWETNRSIEARYRAIFENLNETISLIRPGEGWILGNDASDRILGYPPGTTRLDNRRTFVHPDDAGAAEAAFGEVVAGTRGPDRPWLVRVKAADDSWHWFESVATDLRDEPDVNAVLVSTRDVTDRVELNRQLAHAAGHDPLTDLANRGVFVDRLDAALARSRRERAIVAACFIDLDHFKAINDTRGHQVGDEILCSVADRLRSSIRTEDLAARLGGDEFVVLFEHVAAAADVHGIVERLVTDLERDHRTSVGPLPCMASIGVAFARSPEEPTQLLARADEALYLAKRAGRGRAVYAGDEGELPTV